MRLWYNIFII